MGTGPRGLTQQAWVLHTHTHTEEVSPSLSREHSLGKAYEVLMISIHVSQLNVDEKHDLRGYTCQQARGKKKGRVLKCTKGWKKHTYSTYRAHNKSTKSSIIGSIINKEFLQVNKGKRHATQIKLARGA